MATAPHPAIEVRGRAASPGLALGPLVVLAEVSNVRRAKAEPDAEAADLSSALEAVAAELTRLAAAAGAEGAHILEVQIAMLDDAALKDPALTAIAQGAAADTAWADVLDEQIRDFENAADEYFRARASDLRDVRDRVLRRLRGAGGGSAITPGAIVAATDLPPSRFLELDWSAGGGIALSAGSPTSHVAMLARARGVAMVVGLGPIDFRGHREAAVDGDAGRLLLSPGSDIKRACHEQRETEAHRRREEAGFLSRPAVTRDGRRVSVLVNVSDAAELASFDRTCCDGIGLVRTEFLFSSDAGLPDEERQLTAYRQLLAWAGDRPVTIRTLDAGGDKPIPGLTHDAESNPFLGVRGIRLSLARPEIFRVQLRALARAAIDGNLKVMLPMVTVPWELEKVRRLLDHVINELAGEGLEARRPPLGMMVEVPAAAVAIQHFDADFFSIGTNDLVQYVTASARDIGAVADLADPAHPAVLTLIEAVVREGGRRGVEVSLCGDIAGDPKYIPGLLGCGLSVLSVAAPALARTKAAIAGFRAAVPGR
jgi:phosphoenolpyruvate-protein phosphotransferase (PTS system enzyme I)